jgi:hypothetical protein
MSRGPIIAALAATGAAAILFKVAVRHGDEVVRFAIPPAARHLAAELDEPKAAYEAVSIVAARDEEAPAGE